MPRALYCIVQRKDGWIIKLNDKAVGPCLSMEMAIEAAVRAASKAFRQGCHSHVMVHDGRGFHTLWINGVPALHEQPKTDQSVPRRVGTTPVTRPAGHPLRS